MVELFPLIPILNPYGSHTVMGGQHWNHRGPISVSHRSHLGPNYVSRKYHFSRIISILSRGSHILECFFYSYQILPIWDLYRSYMGKKAYMGPMQDPWDKCPDSAHMGPIYTCLLGRNQICPARLHNACSIVSLMIQGPRITAWPRKFNGNHERISWVIFPL